MNEFYTLKEDGQLFPLAFLSSLEDLKYRQKEIDRLTKNGGQIVKIKIQEA